MKEYGYLINLNISQNLNKKIIIEFINFLASTLESNKFQLFNNSSKNQFQVQIIRDLEISNEELLLLKNFLPKEFVLNYTKEKVYKSSEEFKNYVYVCSKCDKDFFIIKKNEKSEEELICICGNKKFNPMLRDLFFNTIKI
jgi:DNA-directed RNA polymerase subunit RPC12/RpoP